MDFKTEFTPAAHSGFDDFNYDDDDQFAAGADSRDSPDNVEASALVGGGSAGAAVAAASALPASVSNAMNTITGKSHALLDFSADRGVVDDVDIAVAKAVIDNPDPVSMDDAWEVITSFFRENGMVHQQVESFDTAMMVGFPNVVESLPPLVIDAPGVRLDHYGREYTLQYRLKWTNLQISTPVVSRPAGESGRSNTTTREALIFSSSEDEVVALTPQMCRMSNIPYEANMKCDLRQQVYYKYKDAEENSPNSEMCYKDLFIGRVPIMLRSKFCSLAHMSPTERIALGECDFDQGGYFIVNGTEKVIVAQERMASNFVYLFKKTTGKFSWTTEIRSQREGMQATSPLTIKLRQKGGVEGGKIWATIQYLRTDIPIWVLFQALGCESDRDVINRIVTDPFDFEMMALLKPSIEDGVNCTSVEAALDFIGRRTPAVGSSRDERIARARDILNRELLPHMGHEGGEEARKAWFLGTMVNRLLSGELGRTDADDRDHFGKKRIDMAGALMTQSFGTLFRTMAKGVANSLGDVLKSNKEFAIQPIIDRHSGITHGLRYQLATGNWGKAKDGTVLRSGVSQVLNRLTYMSAVSHLRRMNTPLGRDGKLAKPRQLHNTHWGLICPAETPEGQAVGLVKNMALMAKITVGYSPKPVIDFLWASGMVALEDLSVEEVQNSTRVLVNGNWLGCFDPRSLIVHFLRKNRRNGTLRYDTSITFDAPNNEIRIFTDAGRACRPLYVVENNQMVATKGLVDYVRSRGKGDDWSLLVRKGAVEFIDCDEEEGTMVAMFISDVYGGNSMNTINMYPPVENFAHPDRVGDGVWMRDQSKETFSKLDKIRTSLEMQQRQKCLDPSAKVPGLTDNFALRQTVEGAMVKQYFDATGQETARYIRVPAAQLLERWSKEHNNVGFTADDIIGDGAVLSVMERINVMVLDPATIYVEKGREDIPDYAELARKMRLTKAVEKARLLQVDPRTITNNIHKIIGDPVYDCYYDQEINARRTGESIPWHKIIDVKRDWAICGGGARDYPKISREVVHFFELYDPKVHFDLGYELEQFPAPYTDTYTHCEIHPAMIFGVCATLIPFPDHNQSPRNVYQSAMGKQAMGTYMSNYQIRFDSTAHVLFYPQRPLVGTEGMTYFRFKELPAGINTIVAIMTYTGYNQEDSLIMSQSAIDRGYMRSMYYRTYVSEEKMKGSEKVEEFRKPEISDTLGVKHGDYSKIDPDGVAPPGCPVLGDDCIIGKCMPIDNVEGKDNYHFRDCSVLLKNSEIGVVDKVLMMSTSKNTRFVKIKVRSVRIPQIGDKFASRHGQKGTIGVTYRTEDLPFSKEGVHPELLMNPHAVPSRMTIGHVVECLLGKLACCGGCASGDATPFNGLTAQEVVSKIQELGFQKHGNERLYCGFTGKPIQNLIYYGPTYYQRLKHMVDDKIHSRGRGPMTTLTRQPMEGRSREGGLRFGEMERDCMIAHGAAKMLKERLFDHSDAYRIHVCDECGLFATSIYEAEQFDCPACRDKTTISQIAIPYAAKLLFQELITLGIYPRLRLSPV